MSAIRKLNSSTMSSPKCRFLKLEKKGGGALTRGSFSGTVFKVVKGYRHPVVEGAGGGGVLEKKTGPW